MPEYIDVSSTKSAECYLHVNRSLNIDAGFLWETIESLQDRIQTMQTDHNRQLLDMQQKHGKEKTEKEARIRRKYRF